MSGISGFGPRAPAALPSLADDTAATQPPIHELVLPEPVPDVELLSPKAIYDVFAKLVQEYGSQQAKDDLAAGKAIQLKVMIEGMSDLGDLFIRLDPSSGFGWIVGDVNTNSSSGSGQTEAPPM